MFVNHIVLNKYAVEFKDSTVRIFEAKTIEDLCFSIADYFGFKTEMPDLSSFKENDNDLANSFSEFLEDVAPQFRENVVSASEFIEIKLKNKN